MRVKHLASSVYMAFQFKVLQVIIDTKIKFIREQQVVYFVLQAQQVGNGNAIALQRNVNIRERATFSYSTSSIRISFHPSNCMMILCSCVPWRRASICLFQ